MSTLFAGSRTAAGYVDAVGEDARFEAPAVMCTDDNFIYVTELIGCRVRRIDPFTREVTTVASFSSLENPFGITRHPVSGNFYVCNPGYPGDGNSANTITRFDPDWNLLDTWIPDTAYAYWYATPSPDETEMYVAGHEDNANGVINPWWFRIDMTGSITNAFDLLSILTPAPLLAPVGGIAIIDDTVYWSSTRTAGMGIYTTDLNPTVNGDFSKLVAFDSITGSNGSLFSCRQLHVNPSENLDMAFGPSFFEPAPDWAGNGSRILDLGSLSLSDPAVAAGDTHAGQLDPSLNYEADYMRAFDTDFVTYTLLRQDSGFRMYEADGLVGGPHSIEIYGDFPRPFNVGPLHIPHKEWAGEVEAQNYYEMERWVRRMVAIQAPLPLHLPHKTWMGYEELDNYRTIERWARDEMTATLHFPHRNWATAWERENYLAVERWARLHFGP